MDKETMVIVEADRIATVVKALDAYGIEAKVALWGLFDEYETWRLILAAPEFDQVGPLEGYGLLHKALRAAQIDQESLPSFHILRMKDPFIVQLRKIFGKTKSVEGMRLGGQSFGDRFLEEGYIYRIR
ncbi:MAG: hypothetical protein NW208_06035 [Bryobacter sp.]|nr:hypothetical protein [Bryobacter sp.]